MKSFFSKLALVFVALLIVLCHSCEMAEQAATEKADQPKVSQTKPPPAKPAVAEQKPEQRPAEAPAEPANIVAKIGDYTITKEGLRDRLKAELRPYEEGISETEPPDAKTVLLKMVAEKAMITEAREKNYLQNKRVAEAVKRFKEQRLVNLLLMTHLKDKVTAADSEIDEIIKARPKLNRQRAEAIIKRAKANKLISRFYSRIYEGLHVQKFSDNFPKVVQIRRRLLLNAEDHPRIKFVRTTQVRNDLTQDEKDLVLAEYDGGKVTLKDWFEALCDFSPPSRPKDLDTAEGVERLLDRVLRKPLFIAEAVSRGLDKDEDLLNQLKQWEDKNLLNEAIRKKADEIKDPSKEQMLAYFNSHRDEFKIIQILRIDQIWSQDLETAEKAKAELSSGADFQAAKKKYSLDKQSRPTSIYPASKGQFYEDLWNAEPNEIVGPIKGSYRGQSRWRIVKIVEKKPSQLKEYSRDIENRIKYKKRNERREVLLAEYRKELLEKYSYEIYTERIADIEPLKKPEKEPD